MRCFFIIVYVRSASSDKTAHRLSLARALTVSTNKIQVSIKET